MNVKNQDLELAKLKLIEEDLSLVIVKQEKNLVAASAADKIVGVAAAMLCVYAGVASVFTLTISEEGIRVLEDNNISYLFEKKVSNILNRSKNDVCPFEKLAMDSGSSDEAYVKLKSFASQMMRKSAKTD